MRKQQGGRELTSTLTPSHQTLLPHLQPNINTDTSTITITNTDTITNTNTVRKGVKKQPDTLSSHTYTAPTSATKYKLQG